MFRLSVMFSDLLYCPPFGLAAAMMDARAGRVQTMPALAMLTSCCSIVSRSGVELALHLVKLVDAAHAPMGAHERTSLVSELTGGWILDDRGGETRDGHPRTTAAVHPLVRHLRPP